MLQTFMCFRAPNDEFTGGWGVSKPLLLLGLGTKYREPKNTKNQSKNTESKKIGSYWVLTSQVPKEPR
jgi:hypothetical protein